MRRPGGPVYLLGRAATPGAAETRQFLSRKGVDLVDHIEAHDRIHVRQRACAMAVALIHQCLDTSSHRLT